MSIAPFGQVTLTGKHVVKEFFRKVSEVAAGASRIRCESGRERAYIMAAEEPSCFNYPVCACDADVLLDANSVSAGELVNQSRHWHVEPYKDGRGICGTGNEDDEQTKQSAKRTRYYIHGSK